MAGDKVVEAKTIREAIGIKLSEIAPEVEDKILSVFVDREVDKRAKAVVNVIDQVVKMESDLRKMKADTVTYNEDGTVASSTWTKGKLDEKTKLMERITKYSNAVNKAIDKGDYGDVYNLGSGKDSTSD